MKSVHGLLASWLPLVAYLALPNCNAVETDPTDIGLRLTRSHPELPYVRPSPHESVSSAVGGVDGEVKLSWGLGPHDPIPTWVDWSLTVVPPDAGRVESFDIPGAQASHDPTALDGTTTVRFHATLQVDPAFEGTVVRVAGTARDAESHRFAEATLDIPIAARGPDSQPPMPPRLEVICRRDPSGGQPPLTVSFTAKPAGCAHSCSVTWDFGDDAVGEGSSVTHVYDRAGEFEAVGVVHDGDEVANCSKTVVVKPPEPKPGPSGTPTVPGQ
jgi:hypothetical protein